MTVTISPLLIPRQLLVQGKQLNLGCGWAIPASIGESLHCHRSPGKCNKSFCYCSQERFSTCFLAGAHPSWQSLFQVSKQIIIRRKTLTQEISRMSLGVIPAELQKEAWGVAWKFFGVFFWFGLVLSNQLLILVQCCLLLDIFIGQYCKEEHQQSLSFSKYSQWICILIYSKVSWKAASAKHLLEFLILDQTQSRMLYFYHCPGKRGKMDPGCPVHGGKYSFHAIQALWALIWHRNRVSLREKKEEKKAS